MNRWTRPLGRADDRRAGYSPALQPRARTSPPARRRDSEVLITGESGVGKDLVARYVHAQFVRAAQRFVALNCASFSETLLETELFGHVKGSFTGAYRDKIGKLQRPTAAPSSSTRSREMSLRMQAMLLRFLENGEVRPVGSDAPATRVDVRVISATNRDLPDMVAKGEFREDLLYRIKVAQMRRAAAARSPRGHRARSSQHTIAEAWPRSQIDRDAMEALERYRWPGNVRELQNVVEQMLALAMGDASSASSLPPAVTARQGGRRTRCASAAACGGRAVRRADAGGCHFWNDVHRCSSNRDPDARRLRLR